MIHLNLITKALYAITVLGVADAAYLTIAKYDTAVLFCPTSGVVNCAGVLGSQFSTFFGLPISILGAILFLLVPFMIVKGNETYGFLWMVAGGGALIYSISAMTILGEICEYCLFLDLLIVLVMALSYYRANHDQRHAPGPERDFGKR